MIATKHRVLPMCGCLLLDNCGIIPVPLSISPHSELHCELQRLITSTSVIWRSNFRSKVHTFLAAVELTVNGRLMTFLALSDLPITPAVPRLLQSLQPRLLSPRGIRAGSQHLPERESLVRKELEA
jgi:hypothetical protein